jgi:hypothetical protein
MKGLTARQLPGYRFFGPGGSSLLSERVAGMDLQIRCAKKNNR